MKIARRVARGPRVEMVPLIDTFFLLLAFFISSVLAMEVIRGLPVELPAARGAQQVPAGDRLLVTLDPSGGLQVEGTPATVEQLADRVRHHPRRASLRVGLRADQATPYRRVVEVLSALREAGAARVALMTS